MELHQKNQEDVVIFALKGRLDGSATEAFAQRVEDCLEQGATKLVFDCGELEYINSSGLRVLIMAYQRLHSKNGSVSICSLKDYIKEIFDISGYNQIFAMHADCAVALDALQQNR